MSMEDGEAVPPITTPEEEDSDQSSERAVLCPQCNKKLPKIANFCGYCGAKVKEQQETTKTE